MNKSSTFVVGLFLFAAVTGFLASTNNGALLQPTLFAIGGAIVVVLGIVQKFYIDRTTANQAEAMVPELARQAQKSSGGDVNVQLLAQHVKRQLRPEGKYVFLAEQAGTLGAVLISLSLGFAAGFAGGTCLRRIWPLLLTDKFAVAVPWSAGPPSDPMRAAGWIAISERMSQAGVPAEAIRAIYQSAESAPCTSDAKKECDASKAAIAELGRNWLGGAGPASSSSTGASANAAAAKNPVPALSPIIESTKGK